MKLFLKIIVLKIYLFIRCRILGKEIPQLETESEAKFVWNPETFTIELLSDNVHLKMGKYLKLEQEIEPDDGINGTPNLINLSFEMVYC